MPIFNKRPECDWSFMKITGQKNPYTTVLRAVHGFSVFLSFFLSFLFFSFLSFFLSFFLLSNFCGKPPTFYSGTLHFLTVGLNSCSFVTAVSFLDIFQTHEKVWYSSKRVSDVILFPPFSVLKYLQFIAADVRKYTFPFILSSVIDRFQCIMSHATNIASRFQ